MPIPLLCLAPKFHMPMILMLHMHRWFVIPLSMPTVCTYHLHAPMCIVELMFINSLSMPTTHMQLSMIIVHTYDLCVSMCIVEVMIIYSLFMWLSMSLLCLRSRYYHIYFVPTVIISHISTPTVLFPICLSYFHLYCYCLSHVHAYCIASHMLVLLSCLLWLTLTCSNPSYVYYYIIDELIRVVLNDQDS